MKICDEIMTPIPTLQPALSQVSLSLNTYHKTVPVDDLHKLGHEMSYTETRFIDSIYNYTFNYSQRHFNDTRSRQC